MCIVMGIRSVLMNVWGKILRCAQNDPGRGALWMIRQAQNALTPNDMADAFRLSWRMEVPWWIQPRFFTESREKTDRFEMKSYG